MFIIDIAVVIAIVVNIIVIILLLLLLLFSSLDNIEEDVQFVIHRNISSSQQPVIEAPSAAFVCVRSTRPVIISTSTLAGLLTLTMIIVFVVYKFRGEIKIILYFKLGWRPFDRSDNSDILDKVVKYKQNIHRKARSGVTWGQWLADSHHAWWRYQIETFSALLAICAGNSPVPGEFPAQRPATRGFGVFFDLCLNKRLGKQPWGWWFEALSCPLKRHCNEVIADVLSRLAHSDAEHWCSLWSAFE